jgi:hypothetical protein
MIGIIVIALVVIAVIVGIAVLVANHGSSEES